MIERVLQKFVLPQQALIMEFLQRDMKDTMMVTVTMQ